VQNIVEHTVLKKEAFTAKRKRAEEKDAEDMLLFNKMMRMFEESEKKCAEELDRGLQVQEAILNGQPETAYSKMHEMSL
jgi:hypothetical protein